VSYYGDLVRCPSGFFDGVIAKNMATAIVRYYCPNGFLIAADGLVVKSEDKTVLNDHMQKIFPLPNRSTAFSITGVAGLGLPGEDPEPRFEFLPVVREVAQTVSMKNCRYLSEYAAKVGRKVNQRLRATHQAQSLDLPTECRDNEIGQTIAEIFFDGYLNEVPSRASARFYHEDGAIAEPHIEGNNLHEGIWYSGPSSLVPLYKSDPRFAEFMRPFEAPILESLQFGAIHARAYIEACSSPLGREIDPERCSTIGGHIHMATITKDKGFQWIEGFEPTTGS
jgi:hypothetical protein